MSGSGDCPAEIFIRFTVPCIETVITGHFEMLFRYMLDKQGNKVHGRERFFHVGIVFVFIVVEGHIFPIIGIDAGGSNNRAAEITADVFYNRVSVAEIWFGIDIETIFIFFVNGGFCFFERRTDTVFQFIQEGGLERFAEISIVEMFYNFPEAVIREGAFGKKAMDMGIPFQRPAESMQDTDEAGDKVSAFI